MPACRRRITNLPPAITSNISVDVAWRFPSGNSRYQVTDIIDAFFSLEASAFMPTAVKYQCRRLIIYRQPPPAAFTAAAFGSGYRRQNAAIIQYRQYAATECRIA